MTISTLNPQPSSPSKVDAMVSHISLQKKAWMRGVGTHVALGPDPADIRQVGGSTSREESSGGTGCPRTGTGFSDGAV